MGIIVIDLYNYTLFLSTLGHCKHIFCVKKKKKKNWINMKQPGMCGDGLTVPVSSPRGKDTTPLPTPVPGPDSLTSPSPPVVLPKRGKSLQPTQVPVSTRASIVFPLLASGGLFNQNREQNNISK